MTRAEKLGGPRVEPAEHADRILKQIYDIARKAALNKDNVAKKAEQIIYIDNIGLICPSRQLDKVLSSLRAWCSCYDGLELTPRRWEFCKQVHDDELTPDERVDAEVRFTPADAKVVLLRQFGLGMEGNPVYRPCKVTISAGSAPVHYEGLLALLDLPNNEVEETLRQRLLEWPSKKLGSGDLRQEARSVFSLFFDHFKQKWHPCAPNKCDRFEEGFRQLLQKNFALHVIDPDMQDVRDTKRVERVASSVGAHEIKEILRPMLLSQDGSPIIKARVKLG